MGIIIIPFVFWGMGSNFTGGSKNIIVVIDKEKYSTQTFVDSIQKFASDNQKIEANQIEQLLSSFIGERLIEKEVEHFGIQLSNKALTKLIKHQKDFKRENKFSRTEYEKFLLKNNITAVNFESILSKQEKKKQLLDFISGGISPPKFLANISYNRINQKRSIELINLNDIFNKQLNFSEEQIRTYYENNTTKYTEIYKSIKLIELSPKELVEDDKFSDLFFKIIDEIDDLVIRGENIDYIVQKYNLTKPNPFTINKLGKSVNSKIDKKLSKYLINKVFDINDIEPTVLIEDKDKYFIAELVNTEDIQKDIDDDLIKKKVLLDLSKKTKRKLIAEIIDKINKNNFNKYDFDKLSKDKNVNIKKISLNSQNDDKILKKEIVNQIYTFPEKKVIIVSDIGLSENFLIYIDKIKNVTIDENSEEYQTYFNLSKNQIVSELYNTYENYIQKKYKIDINYQALDVVKNAYN